MTLSRRPASSVRSLATGAIVNLAAAAPAFAAPSFALPSIALPFDLTAVPPQEILLWSSVALLVVALTAKVIRDRHQREPAPQGPDLRWWKNPPPTEA
jgi:hypothetical protein